MRTLIATFLLFFSFSLYGAALSPDQFKLEAKKIKMIIVDFEGVLASDQEIISHGEKQWILSARDREAIIAAKDKGIRIVIVSRGRMADPVIKWARDAGADYLYGERKSKDGLLLDLHFKTFLSEKNMAYIAGSSADLDTMKACGFLIAPQDAPATLKEKANFIIGRKSGEGVLDEVLFFVLGS